MCSNRCCLRLFNRFSFVHSFLEFSLRTALRKRERGEALVSVSVRRKVQFALVTVDESESVKEDKLDVLRPIVHFIGYRGSEGTRMKKSLFLQSKKSLESATSLPSFTSSIESMSEEASLSRSSKNTRKLSSGKQSPPRGNLIMRLTSRTSLGKSKKGKSEATVVDVRSTKVLHADFDTELVKAFKYFDANGDGQISIAELGSVLGSLGDALTEHELQQIMLDADENRDGFISLAEFINVNKSLGTTKQENDAAVCHNDPLRIAFDMFDKDGNLHISADELQAMLLSLGDKSHTIKDCRRMISCVDRDGDGLVDYQEFQQLMGVNC